MNHARNTMKINHTNLTNNNTRENRKVRREDDVENDKKKKIELLTGEK
jgi:hypothetical protein